jgi:endonuclease/exonuclease/phosphatase family metal-dependent hydrolase
MTRNLYMGVSLEPLFGAPPELVPRLVARAWRTVQATDFATRAQALADEIAAKRPHLVGLQEAALWRIQSPGNGTGPDAEAVVYDFVAILVAELANRGLDYVVLAQPTAFDVELPSSTGDDIRLTDRDAVLLRVGGGISSVMNIQTGRFFTHLVVPVAGFDVPVYRTWIAVDVDILGRAFRFIDTHLERFHDLVQLLQAYELLDGPANTSLDVILVCDCNSRADGTGTATYPALIAAGFADAWNLPDPGDTCCQRERLHGKSTLVERIDLVLARGAFEVLDVDRVGEDPHDRFRGLWPSDHAGVAATLRVP